MYNKYNRLLLSSIGKHLGQYKSTRGQLKIWTGLRAKTLDRPIHIFKEEKNLYRARQTIRK